MNGLLEARLNEIRKNHLEMIFHGNKRVYVSPVKYKRVYDKNIQDYYGEYYFTISNTPDDILDNIGNYFYKNIPDVSVHTERKIDYVGKKRKVKVLNICLVDIPVIKKTKAKTPENPNFKAVTVTPEIRDYRATLMFDSRTVKIGPFTSKADAELGIKDKISELKEFEGVNPDNVLYEIN